MLTLAELIAARDDHVLTENGFLVRLLQILTPENMDDVRAALERKPGQLDAFEQWVASVGAGAYLFSGGVRVGLSTDTIEAARIWRVRWALKAFFTPVI